MSIHGRDDDRKLSQDYVEDTGSVDLNAVALAAQYVPGSAAEKAFVRRIDKRIIVSLSHLAKSSRLTLSPLSGSCTLYHTLIEPTSGKIRFQPPNDAC